MTNTFLFLAIGIQLWLLIWAIVCGYGLNVLPSTVWTFTMIIPFMATSKFFPTEAASSQFRGVLIFYAAFQISDYISVKASRKNQVKNEVTKDPPYLGTLFWLSLVLSFLIPLIHYLISKQIPFLDQVFSQKTYQEISIERENYSKLSNVPSILKILPNLLFTVFAPFAVIALIWKRRIPIALIVFFWSLFYALSSTADFPVLVLIASILIGAMPLLSQNHKRLIMLFCLTALTATTISGLVLLNTVNQSTLPCIENGIYTATPGDKIRTCREEHEVWVNPVVDRIGYRVFITPIEVSNNWYQYFVPENQHKREIISIVDRNLTKSAANEVGIWAFVTKFPDQYLESNASYGSIDADAFSFGWTYMILISLSVFLIRISPIFRFQRLASSKNLFEGFIVAQLCIFPFLASLQAMLFTQGLLLVLALMWINHSWIDKFIKLSIQSSILSRFEFAFKFAKKLNNRTTYTKR
jgi:hypothetical protein